MKALGILIACFVLITGCVTPPTNGEFDANGIHRETGTMYDPLGFDVNGIHSETGTMYDPLGFNVNGIHSETETMFDSAGFDRAGIHSETGTMLDTRGFNSEGIHNETEGIFDARGFDREGLHNETRTLFDSAGFDQAGLHNETGSAYSPAGFDRDSIHIETETVFNSVGFDREGFDRNGLDRNGLDREGFDRNGFNVNGFDRNGFDRNGFNVRGFNSEGYDRAGFNPRGYDREGFNKYGYNADGLNRDGYDRYGFDAEGIHPETGTLYDPNGFDRSRLDKNGFTVSGTHPRTGTRFNPDGFDRNGYDINGLDEAGFNRDGYDRNGFNAQGFDREGYDRNGFNADGFNRNGFDRRGFNADGFNAAGFDRLGYDRNGFNGVGIHSETGQIYNPEGFNREGFDREGFNINGIYRDIQKVLAHDSSAEDLFGASVAISGDTAIVGAPLDDEDGFNSGSVYIFTQRGSRWGGSGKLTASDGANRDGFGYSVAISGNTAIVGAYQDDDRGIDSGSAYIFTREGTTWVESAKLVASDGAMNALFGHSVAISGDTAIVGAHQDNDRGNNSGSAYIFTRIGARWIESAKLAAGDAAAEDMFGFSVAISGNTAIVGAYRNDDNGTNSGSAYIFTRSGSDWIESMKLRASDASAGDWFGRAVAISAHTAIVSATMDDDGEYNSGSAYIFNRAGAAWIESAKLQAKDPEEAMGFGNSLSLDGNTVIVAAFAADLDSETVGAFGNTESGQDSGAVYIFTQNDSAWTEMAKIIASDAATDDWFGISISISGGAIIIGASGDDDSGDYTGSTYFYRYRQ